MRWIHVGAGRGSLPIETLMHLRQRFVFHLFRDGTHVCTPHVVNGGTFA
jgi:hypothetical protein